MSPFDWASLVTGMNFALGSYEKFQPSFRDEKRSKILGTRSAPNSRNKANMAKHTNFDFRAHHNFGNSESCITVVNWILMTVKYSRQCKFRQCHPGRQNSSCFHPGNRTSPVNRSHVKRP